jgi:catechol 2,3-dioxygenase-like lactoylglutathione lyase family enzyme
MNTLREYPVYASIPVTDLKRSQNFYGNTLGLSLVERELEDGLVFQAGDKTQLYLYPRGPSKADHTLAGFRVNDIEMIMNALSKDGVMFEQYDLPGIKTDERGIAHMRDVKSAWFKDPDGNILAITEKQ